LPASDQTGPRGRRADHLRGRRLTVPDTRRRVIHGPAPRRVAAARPDAQWTGRSLGGSVPSTASVRPPEETCTPPSSAPIPLVAACTAWSPTAPCCIPRSPRSPGCVRRTSCRAGTRPWPRSGRWRCTPGWTATPAVPPSRSPVSHGTSGGRRSGSPPPPRSTRGPPVTSAPWSTRPANSCRPAAPAPPAPSWASSTRPCAPSRAASRPSASSAPCTPAPTVVNHTVVYARTTDAVVRIGNTVLSADNKTSKKVRGDYALQGVAVVNAEQLLGDDGTTREVPEMTGAFVVHLPEAGGYQAV